MMLLFEGIVMLDGLSVGVVHSLECAHDLWKLVGFANRSVTVRRALTVFFTKHASDYIIYLSCLFECLCLRALDLLFVNENL